MRRALRSLLALVVLLAAAGTAGRTAVASETSPSADIRERLLSIPGMRLIEEKPYPGYRFLVLEYTQPVDHRNPDRGTFRQRLTVLHKAVDRPTVFHTSGYHVSTTPGRREPTQIVDGNQVSLEHRFFTPSRPNPADWSTLDIRQAADDQHRLFTALKPIYPRKWLATGGSKGGMTATYYERFHPGDMDGVVAYVAPNDVVDREDSAYDRFFATVGTAECRARLEGVQREALVRRESLKRRYAEHAAREGYTFGTIGGLDRAYEAVVLDYLWGFWQYGSVEDCAAVPADAERAGDDAIWESVDSHSGFAFYTDQMLAPYTPYFYQAGTQLGSPDIRFPHIEREYVRYGYQPPRHFVPREIPMRFRPGAMRDVDRWVRHHAHRMLFVNGENDPWGAEPFRLGAGARDSHVLTAPGMNHGADVAGLAPKERALATARILDWAGVAPARVRADPETARPLAAYDGRLDRREQRREGALRP
ncbi:S28 family serine protease [Streptomyces sp. ZYX-F-203]